MQTTSTFISRGIALSLLCLVFPFQSSSAKLMWSSPPLSVVEEGSAPEINFAFSYGMENDPVSATSSLNLVYVYTGYSIDEAESNIKVDLQDSWFGNASQVSVSYLIDHEAREVQVILTRNDNQQIGGYGFTVRLKGIIIVVDDLDRIKNPFEDFVVDAYFSTDTETLALTMGGDFGPLELSLYSLDGALIAKKHFSGGTRVKWNLGNIALQIYVLEMANDKMVMRKKIAIGR